MPMGAVAPPRGRRGMRGWGGKGWMGQAQRTGGGSSCGGAFTVSAGARRGGPLRAHVSVVDTASTPRLLLSRTGGGQG